MRVYFIESDSGCVRLAPPEAERLEQEVADAIAGKRLHVLMLPPGRHVVAMDVPQPAAKPAGDDPKKKAEPRMVQRP